MHLLDFRCQGFEGYSFMLIIQLINAKKNQPLFITVLIVYGSFLPGPVTSVSKIGTYHVLMVANKVLLFTQLEIFLSRVRVITCYLLSAGALLSRNSHVSSMT